MKALSILLIEDDMIEVLKFNRVLNSLPIEHKVIEANNGEAALKILMDEKKISDLVVLDLNMPKMNGKEFLRILKEDPILKYIPTIILSTSNNNVDIKECYEIGIAGYLMKPLKYEDYMEKVQNLISYWSISELVKA